MTGSWASAKQRSKPVMVSTEIARGRSAASQRTRRATSSKTQCSGVDAAGAGTPTEGGVLASRTAVPHKEPSLCFAGSALESGTVVADEARVARVKSMVEGAGQAVTKAAAGGRKANAGSDKSMAEGSVSDRSDRKTGGGRKCPSSIAVSCRCKLNEGVRP